MELSSSILDQLRETLEREDNVVGYSHHDVTLPDGRSGVRLYVAEDRPEATPSEAAGLPVVETVVAGRPQKYAVQVGANPKQKVRPLVAGYSISGEAGGTGTLGYFVQRKGAVCVLSCCHVMPKVGGAVIQPGTADKGTGTDKVADVVQALDKPEQGVDCAAAKLVDQTKGTGWNPAINDITGTVSGTSDAVSLEQKVLMSGRTSGATTGKVKELGASILFDEGLYVDQIAVTKGFATNGDSGALVLTEELKAVGIVMGGAKDLVWVNKIKRVFSALDAALV